MHKLLTSWKEYLDRKKRNMKERIKEKEREQKIMNE